MRLLILSDLHHDVWGDKAPIIDPAISRPDVVILAGDINTGGKSVDWAARTFSGLPVIYVHGNHEAYGDTLEEAQGEIVAACAPHPNLHFLNCGELVIGNVRFLGATLWTDFRLFGDDSRQLVMQEAETGMSDYQCIRLATKGYRKLRAADTARFHAQHKAWLHQKLAEPFDGSTVVVTHMAPSMSSVVYHYDVSDLLSAAYASRLDSLVELADLWVHGHMHHSLDYPIGKGRVVANPCGYPNRDGSTENPDFNPNRIVDVPGTVDAVAR
ncbi:putative phosphodiesterase [Actimicrobium sp. GrIS 1.19]|uniref:metallophosphoesterase n=1 Tax=Actimicrobium sp. GrIS 1.19 TaxID=3071708 RepID=UPI002E0C6B43|nr:putative phosphodiesterase [Actimicrobium sp. GrIS 1.19]